MNDSEDQSSPYRPIRMAVWLFPVFLHVGHLAEPGGPLDALLSFLGRLAHDFQALPSAF